MAHVYKDGVLVDETEATPTAEPGEPIDPPLPNEIAMWRIRAVLAYDGVEDSLDAAVEALPDTADNRRIKSMWRRGGAPNFVRDSERVAGMVAAFSGEPLNLTWEMVDDWRARAHALAA